MTALSCEVGFITTLDSKVGVAARRPGPRDLLRWLIALGIYRTRYGQAKKKKKIGKILLNIVRRDQETMSRLGSATSVKEVTISCSVSRLKSSLRTRIHQHK